MDPDLDLKKQVIEAMKTIVPSGICGWSKDGITGCGVCSTCRGQQWLEVAETSIEENND